MSKFKGIVFALATMFLLTFSLAPYAQEGLPGGEDCNSCSGGCMCQNGHCPKKWYNSQIFDCPSMGGCCTGPL